MAEGVSHGRRRARIPRTLGPQCAILAVEVLAQLLDEREQFQFAILQSCARVSRRSSVARSPPQAEDGRYVRVALAPATALASFLLRS